MTQRNSKRGPDTDVTPAVRREARWLVPGLSLTTLALMLPIFPQGKTGRAPEPWPLAFICLVPWLVAVVRSQRPIWTYVCSYVLGVAFFAIAARWLWQVTPPGYVALVLYLGVYVPAAAWPLRHLVRERGVALTLAAPLVWTAAEFIRGTGVLAFPWLMLGQSPYRAPTMIQIADLGGVYAITFVFAAVNGWIADWMLKRKRTDWSLRPTRPAIGVTAACVALFVVTTVGYGRWRIGQDAHTDGPKVSVVQGNYPLIVSALTSGREVSLDVKRRTYFRDALEAANKDKPDLIVLPETPWSMNLNHEFRAATNVDPADGFKQQWSRACDLWLKLLANPGALTAPPPTVQGDEVLMPLWMRHGERGRRMTVVSGGFAEDPTRKNVRFNSAFVYTPGAAEPLRYDKVHLVLFGEYVPFRGGALHEVYLWLNGLTPFGHDGYEYSLTAGSEFRTFDVTLDGKTDAPTTRSYQFATPICYEDTIPYVCRAFAKRSDGGSREKGVDFFLNISNDGWFAGSNELPQHLAVSVFRAVENRVAIARAVNTGLSGFVDSVGRIRGVIPVDTHGYRTETLRIDSRYTAYTRWGDVFAIFCTIVALGAVADAIRHRRRRRTAGVKKDAKT